MVGGVRERGRVDVGIDPYEVRWVLVGLVQTLGGTVKTVPYGVIGLSKFATVAPISTAMQATQRSAHTA